MVSQTRLLRRASELTQPSENYRFLSYVIKAHYHTTKSSQVALALLSWWLLKGVRRDNGLFPEHTAAGIPESGEIRWQ
jgi:hypothetical protein